MLLPAKQSSLATVYRNEQGMTLIELLASLTLLMILLGVLSQFLYTGVHLWGQNDRAAERQRQLLLITRTISNDLAAMVDSPFLPEPALSGDDYQFRFWVESGKGLVQVKYHYDQSAKQILKTAGFWGGEPQDKVIMENVTGWKIEYFRPDTKNWELQWTPDLKDEIPPLIRVTVKTEQKDLKNNKTEENELGPLSIPIKVWHKASTADEK